MDSETGEIGIAVHSKVFSVGGIVSWVKADVGAVATQSLVNISLGPIGLELLEEGRTSDQVLEHFKEIDPGIDLRQLGILSVKHGALTFTGDNCISWAGGRTGINYSCQGNILANSEVIDAMADAFENSKGTFAERLVSALKAAEEKGGDARGSQSASLIVEQKGKGRAGYGDRKLELRVEDHENPIDELMRLVNIHLLYDQIQQTAILAQEDLPKAISILESALNGRTDRISDEAWLSLATLYHRAGEPDNAINCINTCLRIHPGMINIIKEYPRLGIGFDDDFLAII